MGEFFLKAPKWPNGFSFGFPSTPTNSFPKELHSDGQVAGEAYVDLGVEPGTKSQAPIFKATNLGFGGPNIATWGFPCFETQAQICAAEATYAA